MTVSEMITKLQTMRPDATVELLMVNSGDAAEVINVFEGDRGEVVIQGDD